MSTKIYEAYKVDESVSMLKLHKILKGIKAEVVPFYQTLALDPGTIEMHKLMFSSTADEKQKNIFKKTFGSGLWTDVTESCVVYFHKTGTYIQFFMASRFRPLYEKVKNFKDFHYQNHTDIPKEVTRKEWNNRRKIWDDIYGPAGIPSRAGFTYNFYTYDEFDLQLWSNAMNSPKKEINETIAP